MTRFLCLALVIVVVVCAAQHALAQGPKLPITLGKPPGGLDGIESARFTGPGDNFLQEHLRLSGEQAFAGANLQMYSNRFLGIESYEVTDLDLALEGAGAGATLGLFTGAVANTAGLWDEDTSWYIGGAAAALGAFLGYARGTSEPAKRTRYRWTTSASGQ